MGSMKGKFICIEGIDGAGKTTQVQKLLDRMPGAVTFREPGGTQAGEAIRGILLHGEVPLNERTEVLLFMAARAELMVKVKETLDRGITVIMDRWAFSTFAYQHILSKREWEDMTNFVSGNCWPDLVIWLDLSVRENKGDRIESRGVEYFKTTRDRYQHLASTMPRIKKVDALMSVDRVAEVIWTVVNR